VTPSGTSVGRAVRPHRLTAYPWVTKKTNAHIAFEAVEYWADAKKADYLVFAAAEYVRVYSIRLIAYAALKYGVGGRGVYI
jgi:hypothetical protein